MHYVGLGIGSMSGVCENVVRVLASLSIGPMHNFEFAALDRRTVSKLWLGGCVKLLPGDVWFITKHGQDILDASLKINDGADLEILRRE